MGAETLAIVGTYVSIAASAASAASAVYMATKSPDEEVAPLPTPDSKPDSKTDPATLTLRRRRGVQSTIFTEPSSSLLAVPKPPGTTSFLGV